MGPNGSGKSTFSNVLMGRPDYEVTDGEIIFNGEDIVDLPVDERSHKGLFLAFQYPVEIPSKTMAIPWHPLMLSPNTLENLKCLLGIFLNYLMKR